MSKSMVRSVKNVTKGYSSVEVKVRNATSNDAWGPVGSDMAEIAQMTYNTGSDFHQIMDMLDKRMNDKGKNWRHVLKALKVLDYCLHEGSELCCTWARNNIYIIRTLREFQYIDDDGRDVGQNVRVSAKELTSLIQDEERLRLERSDRKSWKSRVTGIEEFPSPNHEQRTRPPRERRQRPDEDDLEYRLAIEASKNEAEEEKRRRGENGNAGEDDDDLAKAIKLSKEEEDLRRRQLEESTTSALFDEPLVDTQPTGYNQGYQQQGAVDWYGNPMEQQPQSTGFLNNAYAQPTGMQGQPTGYQQPGFGYGYQQQAQPTGYDQFQQQQPQFVQPQQTAFNANNPYGAQQQPQDNFSEPQSALAPGSNNPWATPNQAAEPQKPQPTGSNNPFASSFNRPASTPAQTSRPPTLDTLQEQKTRSQFNTTTFNPPVSFSTPSSSTPTHPSSIGPPPAARETNPQHARLNALLASGEGQDTFGNTGEMRIPAQHTAPGTFVNSAGAGAARLTGNATGNNPFLHSQFTGMPQTTGFGGQQLPAQTGPAGGGGSANPFGAQRPGAQPGPNTGSLIDL